MDYSEMENIEAYNHIILPFRRVNVTIDMPQGSHGALSDSSIESNPGSHVSTGSHGSTLTANSSHSAGSHSTARSHVKFDDMQYHGAEAWWSVGEFLQQGTTHKGTGMTLTHKQEEEIWDLSDSLADLYHDVNKREKEAAKKVTHSQDENKIDTQKWNDQDTNNGFIRVFKSDSEMSKLYPCTLSTSAQKVCFLCGMPPNSLHVQLNGDIIRRCEPFDCPLAIQNEMLQKIGYNDIKKIQELGSNEDLPWLIKFYAGKPISDSTYSRKQLSGYVHVRKGKLLYQWVKRLCVISGTRLLIYRDRTKTSKPTVVQLAKGAVEEVQLKNHEHSLKLTSSLQGDRSVYLSFTDDADYSKWLRKAKKATAKLPSKADLSNCHLEFLPETVFINEDLQFLNLRHNVLKERPIEEDIYTIGWLDDLPRFYNLQSLNLADNDLHSFPFAVCKIKTLTELNIATNKISEIPAEIVELSSLQILHVHNNHLSALPEEMSAMKSLSVLVLAFNHFTTIPDILLSQSHNPLLSLDSVIMAGNRIERLSHDLLSRMKHIKKIDLRMNMLSLLPSETAKFHFLEHLTHLDVRDNVISDLDVRALKALEYLNCERNNMHRLQVNGMSLKNLFASHNALESFSINPKPEWLVNMDVSYNKLTVLPSWLSECFFLVQIVASHNKLSELPAQFFAMAPKLKVIKLGHNELQSLPLDIDKPVVEELYLDHNQLTDLPYKFLYKSTKLRYLNLTSNKLTSIPKPNQNESLNRLQELYLSANQLEDDTMSVVCHFTRLRILHMAHNKLTTIHNRDIAKLDSLQELNVSGNILRSLPTSLGRHPNLLCLRANSNLLRELPDFKHAPHLKILEVGSNRLSDVSVTNLMTSQVNLLDISGNPDIMVDTGELGQISNWKKICVVDMTGQNRSLLDLRQAPYENTGQPWQTGLSLTSGMRNKLSVSIVNKPKFGKDSEGFFAIFDGGRTDEVTQLLNNMICKTMQQEFHLPGSHQHYLKYTMLAAHRKLKSDGQKVGAAAALCHIKKSIESSSHYVLNVANVGDTEVIISRRGEAVPMSRLFLIHSDKDECQRICKCDGIVTEDGRVNGVTYCTRLLGGSYLFPQVLPDPHTTSLNLHPDDQLIIVANNGLWKYISYQDAVNEIIDIPDPVIAAKRLQDLAQGYGSRESIGVLVIRLLLSDSERMKMKDILKDQFNTEQSIIAELKEKDHEREAERKRRKAQENHDEIPMDIVKLKGPGRKRMQANEVFSDENGDEFIKLKYGPDNVLSNPANWETILQRRLTEEVKNMELQSVFGSVGHDKTKDADSNTDKQEPAENWTASIRKGPKHTVYPNPNPCKSPDVTKNRSWIEPSISTESFHKEYRMPINLDRDAVLFHEMQIARAKSHGASTDSMASTQSVPVNASFKDIDPLKSKSSSHSIEVLIRPPSLHSTHTNYGGSFPTQGTLNNRVMSLDRKGRIKGSCPDVVPIEEVEIVQEKPTFEKHAEDKENELHETSSGGDNFIGTKVDLIESCQVESKTVAKTEKMVDVIENVYISDKNQDKSKVILPSVKAEIKKIEKNEIQSKAQTRIENEDSSRIRKSEKTGNQIKNVVNNTNIENKPEFDVSVVSAYKNSKTLAEKKYKAPQPPSPIKNNTLPRSPPPKPTSKHPPLPRKPVERKVRVISNEQRSKVVDKNEVLKHKSKRAPLPPVSPEMLAKKYMEPLLSNSNLTLQRTSKNDSVISGNPMSNGKMSPSAEVYLKTDVNSNSLTSLDDMYLLMKGKRDSSVKNGHYGNDTTNNVQSTESTMERSLSDQSLIVTYL